MNLNNLQRTILVFLTDGQLSGYDISKKIAAVTFWNATHQQVYRDLIKLESLGLVSHKDIPQDGKPDKKVYSLMFNGYVAIDKLKLTTKIEHQKYYSESTVMLKVGSIRYFEKLASELEKCIESESNALAEIEDEIDYAVTYRKLALMKVELDFALASMSTIDSINRKKHQEFVNELVA